MEKLIKDNLIYVLIIVLVIGGCGYFIYNSANAFIKDSSDLKSQKQELDAKQALLQQKLAQKREEEENQKKVAKSGKVIYEVLGQQFTPEASFGIMFENILSNIANSGVRIRSIDYNYSPQDDKVLMTGMGGYNVCELSFVTVSSYTQLQNFFKNLAKEKYLSDIHEIYIEPYDRDKTILIARFKVRLYTKTI